MSASVREAPWRDNEAAEPPRVVWLGTWSISLDGVYETRASVAWSEGGFLPGLEVSRLGGDCSPSYGEAVPTREHAIATARSRQSSWHRNEDR